MMFGEAMERVLLDKTLKIGLVTLKIPLKYKNMMSNINSITSEHTYFFMSVNL